MAAPPSGCRERVRFTGVPVGGRFGPGPKGSPPSTCAREIGFERDRNENKDCSDRNCDTRDRGSFGVALWPRIDVAQPPCGSRSACDSRNGRHRRGTRHPRLHPRARHRAGVQHGQRAQPRRRADHQGVLQGRAGGQNRRPAVPDRSAPIPGGARSSQGHQGEGPGKPAGRAARSAALLQAHALGLSDPAAIRPAKSHRRPVPGRCAGRPGTDRYRAAQSRLRDGALAHRRPHRAATD